MKRVIEVAALSRFGMLPVSVSGTIGQLFPISKSTMNGIDDLISNPINNNESADVVIRFIQTQIFLNLGSVYAMVHVMPNQRLLHRYNYGFASSEGLSS